MGNCPLNFLPVAFYKVIDKVGFVFFFLVLLEQLL